MDTQKTERFTWGLIVDVFKVLEDHGYKRSDYNGDVGKAIGDMLRMVKSYEGKHGQTKRGPRHQAGGLSG